MLVGFLRSGSVTDPQNDPPPCAPESIFVRSSEGELSSSYFLPEFAGAG